MRKILFILVSMTIFLGCHREQKIVYVDPSWGPDKLITAANEYLQEQDYDHAFEAFNAVYANYPTSRLYTDAILGMAYVYGKKEQYEKQMELLYSLVSENLVPSRIPAIYNQIAEFYEKTSTIMREINPDDTTDLAKARDYYQKAINYALSNDSLSKAEAFYKMALIEFQLGHGKKGLSILKTLKEKYSGNPWAIQAENFMLTYSETGVLPGTVIEDTTAPPEPEQKQKSLDTLQTQQPDTLQLQQESPDTTHKSILEEIPQKEPKKTTELDSLIEKMK